MFKFNLLRRPGLLAVRDGVIERYEGGKFRGRMKVRDVAYAFRMPAGFEGDVNRTHPASILPALVGATAVSRFGQAVMADGAGGVIPVAAGDTAKGFIYGIAVRAHPIQQAQASSDYAPATIGGAVAPPGGAIDILTSGLIMVYCGAGTPVKGGAVFVRCVADSGAHKIGTFETASDTTNTITLDSKSTFNGGMDANNIVELAFNM